MARDEDIFRKLKKETPLVKQRNLQPLSQRDFNPKSVYNIPDEQSIGKRGKKDASPFSEPRLYSYGEEGYSRPTARKESPSELKLSRDEDVKRRPQQKQEFDLEMHYEPKRSVKASVQPIDEPEIFHETVKPVKRTEPAPGLDIISENVKPQRVNEQRRPVISDSMGEDISVMEETAASKAMTLRHELKYYINYRDYILLRSALKALMSPDPNSDENNSYHVRSLYFDDIHDTALREKVAGNDNRYKYRIRIYNFQDGQIKFEKKYKVGQYVGKDSIDLTHSEYDSIIAGEFDFLKDRDEQLAKELYLEMKAYKLRPRVIVDYVREAYVSPFENCRITFDKDLRSGLTLTDIFDPQAPVMPMYDTGVMVLEVKFNRYLPEFIKRVLNNINAADRCAISKYVICRKYD